MSYEELKPCAHCGAIPNRFRERNEFWRVVCICGMRTEAVYPVAIAEQQWNRRAFDEQSAREGFEAGREGEPNRVIGGTIYRYRDSDEWLRRLKERKEK